MADEQVTSYLFENQPWKLNPPADESDLRLLITRIPGFPICLSKFLRKHDGGEGGVESSRVFDLALWGVKDLSHYFDYKNQYCVNWNGYIMIGRSGAGHELLVPLGQDDPPVYACDPLDYEPVSEEVNLLYNSFSELLAARTLS